MFLRIASFVALVCFSSVGDAQDEPPRKGDEGNPALTFLLAEGLIGANAFLSSKSPRGMGGFQAVLVPVLTISSYGNPKAGPAEPWLILVGGGALAVYNLTVDTGKTSEGEIFKTNFVALNALVGLGLAINRFTGKPDENQKVSVAYVPGSRGGNLVFSYRF
jgi:hypothetical protein